MKHPQVIIKKNTPEVEVKPAPIVVKEDDLIWVDESFVKVYIDVRDQSELKNNALYLSIKFNWQIVTDSDGIVCLLPTKKV